jgi:hypothetical protein
MYYIDFVRSGFFQIICSNLREFKQVIVKDHLWDHLTKYKFGCPTTSGQVGSISGLLQSPARIFSNLDK